MAGIVVFGCLVRFVWLERSPPGFFADEAVGAMHIICLNQTGADVSGARLPLFAKGLAGGFHTPVFLYVGAAWTRLFGYSIQSLRSIAAVFTVLTIVGLYLLVRRLVDDRAALWTALAATLSPWGFQFSRIAWDPPLAPCFLIWAIYFFSRSQRLIDAVLSGVCASLAMYSYPPMRVQAPLLLVPLLWLRRRLGGLSLDASLAFLASGFVSSLPLIQFVLTDRGLERVRSLTIFSPVFLNQLRDPSVLGVVGAFLHNLWLHFTPSFLLVSGDENVRHSTQFVGQLSWLDSLALTSGIIFLALLAVARKHPVGGDDSGSARSQNACRCVVIFSLAGYVAGVVPAALTWEALPHALRSIGSWPFVSVLTGLTLWTITERWTGFVYLATAVAVAFAVAFGWDYGATYPQRAALSFDAPVKDAALKARETGDWSEFEVWLAEYSPIALRYYLVRYGGESCASSGAGLDRMFIPRRPSR